MRIKLFLFIFIVSILIIQFSFAIESNEEQVNVTVSSLVEEQIQNQGEAEVLVLTKDDVKDVLNTVSNEISNEKELKFVEGFTGTIDDNGLESLKENPDVIAIEPVVPISLFLQDSVPLINANLIQANQISGVNITGLGQTVCILDTGINFSHLDLGGGFGSNYKVIGGVNLIDSGSLIDYYGHGTHVAGIVGANGAITGVAPGAKLVIVKVCNDQGTCLDSSGIVQGIQWCTNNKDTYDISVISMSLGNYSSLYTNFCDSTFPSTKLVIDNATAMNITVVAASGNNYDSTVTNYPACIKDILSVGATAKNDSISVYSNGNSLTDLLAPGSSINSTYNNNSGYELFSGTSMAVPHVSGSVALLQQYYKEKFNRVLRPSEVEYLLKTSGLKVLDSRNSLTFSRINVSGAIDIPLADLIHPINNSFLAINPLDFNFTAFDNNDSNLNCNLYINGSLNTTLSAPVDQIKNITINGLTEGGYSWNITCQDSNSNVGVSSTNTFEVDLTYPIINITNPSNNSLLNYDTIVFNYSLNELNPSNCSLYSNWTNSWHLNQTKNVTQGNNNFTATLPNGIYLWNVKCIDLAGNHNSSYNNFTIRIDSIPPNLNVTHPITGSYYNYNQSILINYTNNSDAVSVSYILDNGNLTFLNGITSINVTEGNHTLNISANDSLNNINLTSISFASDLTAPSITLNEPSNGATITSGSVTFKYTVTDLGINNCKLYFDDTDLQNTNTAVSSGVQQQISLTVSTGSYSWSVVCTDKTTHSTTSNKYTFTAFSNTTSSSSGSSSSGGGGASSTTSTPIEKPLEKKPVSKYNVDFTLASSGKTAGKPGEERTFSFDGTNEHKIKFDKVSFSLKIATITLKSDPVTVELKLKEPKEVDLNKDKINDIIANLVLLTPDDEAQVELTKLDAGAKVIIEQEKGKSSVNASSTNLTSTTKGNQSLLSTITGFFSYDSFKGITGALSYENLKQNKDTTLPIAGIGLVVIGFLAYRFVYLRKNNKRKIKPFEVTKKKIIKKPVAKPVKTGPTFITKIKSMFSSGKDTTLRGRDTTTRIKKVEEEEKRLEEENERLKEMVERLVKR